MEERHKNMSRRDFLKIVGITATTSATALYGCSSKKEVIQVTISWDRFRRIR